MKSNLKQTQKKKRKKTQSDLWDKFDNMIGVSEESMECLYTKQKLGCRTHCDQCNYTVAYEERFLTCTNPKCGIIYKDNLDQSAEWRYYGADDNHQTDPTRCGMPINPLLKESSYGCKVMCPGNSSYEMRNIRR